VAGDLQGLDVCAAPEPARNQADAGKDPPIQLGDLREVTDVYHG
jgi:hypothetical protein